MAEINMKSLVGKLNRHTKRALETAAGLCVSRNNYEVTVEHVMQALIEDLSCDIPFVLKHFGADGGRIQKAIAAAVEDFRTGNSGRPVFSPILLEWLQQSWLIASLEFNQTEIRSGLMLVTLLSSPERFTGADYEDVFKTIKVADLRAKFHEATHGSAEGPQDAPKGEAGGPAEGGALARFCVDFTAKAKKGEIDPVFGRDREIRQMVDILARRRKNNPIAVGDPGVGKTAVVEGLALRVTEGDVPDVLKGVSLIGLDMGLLQAGASVKGEFENRLKSVIQEIKSSPKPIILFIDEAHTLIGAGGAAGGGDAANLLKPALARGELRTIAATTWSEYKKYFEKDAALARRFQLVKLDEPSAEQAVTMLRGLRERYETAHGVIIRDDALISAAHLASRYIAGRQHPDKGVDLMDTAAARVKVALATKPGELQDLEVRIQELKREVAAYKRDMDNGATGLEGDIKAAEAAIAKCQAEAKTITDKWMKEKEAAAKAIEARKKLAAADEKGKDAARKDVQAALATLAAAGGKDPLVSVEVTPEVVARVIADWTGVPVGKMVRDQAAVLLEFEKKLGERIKGQDHVLGVVGQGIRAAKAGLKNPKTPMGVFLFVGTSGVGKTETALGVADLVFGGERFMTTINMSEFQEKHTVSRLIGSPPGYVGYGEGGVLTEAVRQRPYSAVLLDEIEKADPEVLNLFYQVFDKGSLSDGEGREVDFKDTVVILTSNLATEEIMEACADGKRPPVEELTAAIRPTLSKWLKPALLARMTIVPFYPVNMEALKEITRLKLGQLQRRLKDAHKMDSEIDPKVLESIAERCTEVETGARNVDHIISGTMLPKISNALLQKMTEGRVPAKLKVLIDDKGEFGFEFSG